MSLERKNAVLQKKNEKLEEQVKDLRQRLMEREQELDSDELRLEYLELVDELSVAVNGVFEVQKEYNDLIKEVIELRNEMKKELFRINPMSIFRKRK